MTNFSIVKLLVSSIHKCFPGAKLLASVTSSPIAAGVLLSVSVNPGIAHAFTAAYCPGTEIACPAAGGSRGRFDCSRCPKVEFKCLHEDNTGNILKWSFVGLLRLENGVSTGLVEKFRYQRVSFGPGAEDTRSQDLLIAEGRCGEAKLRCEEGIKNVFSGIKCKAK